MPLNKCYADKIIPDKRIYTGSLSTLCRQPATLKDRKDLTESAFQLFELQCHDMDK